MSQAFKKIISVSGLKLLSLPLTLATSIILARSLGPTAYGDYAYVLAVVALLSLPVGSGLGQFVTREVSRLRKKNENGLLKGLIQWAHRWVLLTTLVSSLALVLYFLLSPAEVTASRVLLPSLALLLVPLSGLSVVRTSVLRAFKYPVYGQIPELLVRPIVVLGLVAGLAASGTITSVTAMLCRLFGSAMSFTAGAFMLAFLSSRDWSQSTPEHQNRRWSRSVLPFSALAAISSLNSELGIIYLGWWQPSSEVAMLRVAQSAASLVGLSLVAVNLVISPLIVDLHETAKLELMRTTSQTYSRVAIVMALPAAIVLVFWGEELLDLFYGEIYASGASTLLAVLAISQLINVLFGSVGTILTMSGYERDVVRGQAVALGINAILLIFLVPSFGALGAAVAMLAGLLGWNVLLSFKCRERLGFHPLSAWLRR